MPRSKWIKSSLISRRISLSLTFSGLRLKNNLKFLRRILFLLSHILCSLSPSVLTPLRQFSPDHHAKVFRCRTNLYDMYRDELRIVGVGPSPLAGCVLRDVASVADADYIHGLGWSELAMRSNSALAEAALLNAEVAFRAAQLRRQHVKDSKVFKATSAELEQKVAELSALLEKDTANAQKREELMREGFEAERLKLRNELRLMEVRLSSTQEELRDVKAGLEQARGETEAARAELANSKELFKEDFLKSEEFEVIVGDKALNFLNVGFNGCVAQFRAAGYPPEGASDDFIDVDKVLNNLPPDL